MTPRARAKRSRAAWVLSVVAAAVSLLLAGGSAWAYWNAGSAAGGNGATTASTVRQGSTPTTSAAGRAVTVSWAASTLSNDVAVAGYLVARYDAGTLVAQTVGAACSGTITATTCTESAVPDGRWSYAVTPVFATNWRGAEGPRSATVTMESAGPTGGSVDAAGLGGTGSRYSRSTSLSLLLAKGSDPSGVASTGATLTRASATLTSPTGADGACGTFGAYSPVATDPVSPRADTVADQACYSYRYLVFDTLGNPTTYSSPSIKVDSTPPGVPTLVHSAFTDATYWSGTGPVYYRSAASSGSFTTTAASTDPVSGIASYGFPALGTNWASTPGALGVTTYSWNGTPGAASGTVTARSNAGGSSSATFTPVVDNSAPTGGAISVTTPTVTRTSVSLAAVSDAGSGIQSRLLQRAIAPMTRSDSKCGGWSAFVTLPAGTNPSSPVSDRVGGGSCYQYRYVVADNVGNELNALSAIVKVTASYAATIADSGGLMSYWRLGEAAVSSDTFTSSAGTLLQNHQDKVGPTWAKDPDLSSTNAVVTAGGRIRKVNSAGGPNDGAFFTASGVPASANYTVEADVYVASVLAGTAVGVVGRADAASNNFYAANYDQSSGVWVLSSFVGNVRSTLGQSSARALTAGSTYRLALDLTGSSIRLLVDGVQLVSTTNTAITAAGRGGVVVGYGAGGGTVTDSTGMHLDNFAIMPPLGDSAGTNSGDYSGGATLGETGAIAGDANSAAKFEGANDFGTVARQISDDFSIEFWFSSSQGVGAGNVNWWQGAGLVDAEVAGAANDFGVSLGSDGRVVAGVGSPDVSIASGTGYNNGLWHHVVFTRVKSTGVMELYLDGVFAGTATGSTASLTGSSTMAFGRVQGGAFLRGSLDEVSVASTAMSASTVASHYNAGR